MIVTVTPPVFFVSILKRVRNTLRLNARWWLCWHGSYSSSGTIADARAEPCHGVTQFFLAGR